MPFKNIYEYWAAIKNAFCSGVIQIIGHNPKGRHKTDCEIVEADRCAQGIEGFIGTACGSERKAFDFSTRRKHRKLKRSVRWCPKQIYYPVGQGNRKSRK